MDVPLWLAVIVVGYLGIKLTRPPVWLVVLLLLGGLAWRGCRHVA